MATLLLWLYLANSQVSIYRTIGPLVSFNVYTVRYNTIAIVILPFISVRKVPREGLKPSGFVFDFQRIPRDHELRFVFNPYIKLSHSHFSIRLLLLYCF